MSGQEIFVIIIVALLLFGADKLPEIARGLSKGMRDFRKATDDIKREFEESTSEIRRDLTDVTNSITNDVTNISQNIKSDVDEVTNDLQKGVDEFKSDINSNVNEVKSNLETEGKESGDEINKDASQPQEPTDNAPEANKDTYQRTINEPDDNYYNYNYKD